jgi:hypothetical protein
MPNINLVRLLTILVCLPLPVFAGLPTDTLVDLNRLNGGIRSFQVGTCDSTLFYVDSKGVVLSKGNIPASARPYRIDIKSQTTEGVYVDNHIELWQTEQNRTVYVEANVIEMATGMRKDGKIWVVIAVVFVLFAAVLGYLLFLQKKIAALENKSAQ